MCQVYACQLLCTISLKVCGAVYIPGTGTSTMSYCYNDNITISRLSGHKPTNSYFLMLCEIELFCSHFINFLFSPLPNIVTGDKYCSKDENIV
jgi:hypothetical protein